MKNEIFCGFFGPDLIGVKRVSLVVSFNHSFYVAFYGDLVWYSGCCRSSAGDSYNGSTTIRQLHNLSGSGIQATLTEFLPSSAFHFSCFNTGNFCIFTRKHTQKLLRGTKAQNVHILYDSLADLLLLLVPRFTRAIFDVWKGSARHWRLRMPQQLMLRQIDLSYIWARYTAGVLLFRWMPQILVYKSRIESSQFSSSLAASFARDLSFPSQKLPFVLSPSTIMRFFGAFALVATMASSIFVAASPMPNPMPVPAIVEAREASPAPVTDIHARCSKCDVSGIVAELKVKISVHLDILGK
jgi:hypothetical protein